jgi:hydroxyacylglutathione hydrolase
MRAGKLEDEFGDIVGKARRGLGLTTQQLAAAAQLSPEQVVAIEAYRLTPDRDGIARIGAALKLDGAKLAVIALDGWLPTPKELPRWGNLAMITSDYGSGIVNCYLQWDEDRNAALFDTGVDADAVLRIITAERLELRCIFITHSHSDHVGALRHFNAKYPKAPTVGGPSGDPALPVYKIGALRVQALNTPGHSRDGVTYVIGRRGERPPVAHVGDSLFAGSLGGANYSYDALLNNVREHILSLPDDTLLCPGHGPVTTVAEEKTHNPFFP